MTDTVSDTEGDSSALPATPEPSAESDSSAQRSSPMKSGSSGGGGARRGRSPSSSKTRKKKKKHPLPQQGKAEKHTVPSSIAMYLSDSTVEKFSQTPTPKSAISSASGTRSKQTAAPPQSEQELREYQRQLRAGVASSSSSSSSSPSSGSIGSAAVSPASAASDESESGSKWLIWVERHWEDKHTRLALKADPTSTVFDLKTEIAKYWAVPAAEQQLVLKSPRSSDSSARKTDPTSSSALSRGTSGSKSPGLAVSDEMDEKRSDLSQSPLKNDDRLNEAGLYNKCKVEVVVGYVMYSLITKLKKHYDAADIDDVDFDEKLGIEDGTSRTIKDDDSVSDSELSAGKSTTMSMTRGVSVPGEEHGLVYADAKSVRSDGGSVVNSVAGELGLHSPSLNVASLGDAALIMALGSPASTIASVASPLTSYGSEMGAMGGPSRRMSDSHDDEVTSLPSLPAAGVSGRSIHSHGRLPPIPSDSASYLAIAEAEDSADLGSSTASIPGGIGSTSAGHPMMVGPTAPLAEYDIWQVPQTQMETHESIASSVASSSAAYVRKKPLIIGSAEQYRTNSISMDSMTLSMQTPTTVASRGDRPTSLSAASMTSMLSESSMSVGAGVSGVSSALSPTTMMTSVSAASTHRGGGMIGAGGGSGVVVVPPSMMSPMTSRDSMAAFDLFGRGTGDYMLDDFDDNSSVGSDLASSHHRGGGGSRGRFHSVDSSASYSSATGLRLRFGSDYSGTSIGGGGGGTSATATAPKMYSGHSSSIPFGGGSHMYTHSGSSAGSVVSGPRKRFATFGDASETRTMSAAASMKHTSIRSDSRSRSSTTQLAAIHGDLSATKGELHLSFDSNRFLDDGGSMEEDRVGAPDETQSDTEMLAVRKVSSLKKRGKRGGRSTRIDRDRGVITDDRSPLMDMSGAMSPLPVKPLRVEHKSASVRRAERKIAGAPVGVKASQREVAARDSVTGELLSKSGVSGGSHRSTSSGSSRKAPRFSEESDELRFRLIPSEGAALTKPVRSRSTDGPTGSSSMLELAPRSPALRTGSQSAMTLGTTTSAPPHPSSSSVFSAFPSSAAVAAVAAGETVSGAHHSSSAAAASASSGRISGLLSPSTSSTAESVSDLTTASVWNRVTMYIEGGIELEIECDNEIFHEPLRIGHLKLALLTCEKLALSHMGEYTLETVSIPSKGIPRHQIPNDYRLSDIKLTKGYIKIKKCRHFNYAISSFLAPVLGFKRSANLPWNALIIFQHRWERVGFRLGKHTLLLKGLYTDELTKTKINLVKEGSKLFKKYDQLKKDHLLLKRELKLLTSSKYELTQSESKYLLNDISLDELLILKSKICKGFRLITNVLNEQCELMRHCLLCSKNNACMVLHPCNHLCVCFKCSKQRLTKMDPKQRRCPVCEQLVDSWVETTLSSPPPASSSSVSSSSVIRRGGGSSSSSVSSSSAMTAAGVVSIDTPKPIGSSASSKSSSSSSSSTVSLKQSGGRRKSSGSASRSKRKVSRRRPSDR